MTIVNTDRSALARVAGAIAKRHGNSGFAGPLRLQLRGSAGQSFACFNIQGMDVHLEGEANDYVGKSMSGGDIAIVPPANAAFQVGALPQQWPQLLLFGMVWPPS